MSRNPYEGTDSKEWTAITQSLSDNFPLSRGELVSTVLEAWEDIFRSNIGSFRIGKDIFPQPQILGFLLHELIPLKLTKVYPDIWCRDRTGHEKDLVCLTDPEQSIEIKTSSSKAGIFGNRSFAQPYTSERGQKKSKDGFYLLVNFDKWLPKTSALPQVSLIRFAWLNHSDWVGQTAATGQAAVLKTETKMFKMVTLYANGKSPA